MSFVCVVVGLSGRRGHHLAFVVLFMSFGSHHNLLCQPWWSSCPSSQPFIPTLLCVLAGGYMQSCDPAAHKAALEPVLLLGAGVAATLKSTSANHQIIEFPSTLLAGSTEIPFSCKTQRYHICSRTDHLCQTKCNTRRLCEALYTENIPCSL